MQLDFLRQVVYSDFFVAYFFVSLTGKNVGKKDASCMFSCIMFTAYLEDLVLIKVDFV